ncbi:hypothetical protein [Streptomyces sp. LN245]|uniref:hypothetical protein n=1 Tax=Streptomyces sp. LN245 TaxID=3112975 RepID=UPI0037101415
MSDTIVMRHPTLPDHQEIEVPRDAMPHYTPAGWQQVPQEELDARAALKAKAAAEAVEAALAAERSRAAEATEPGPDEAAETTDEPDQSEPEAPTEKPARSRKASEKKTEES